MNTISHPDDLPRPPKTASKPLKSVKRENEYFQKKKIQELNSKIKREKSNERSEAKQKVLTQRKSSRSKSRKEEFVRALEGMFGGNIHYNAE